MATSDRLLSNVVDDVARIWDWIRSSERKQARTEQHEALTSGGVGMGFLPGHAAGEENGIWLVPIPLHSLMRVRRLSAFVQWVSPGPAGNYALALYRSRSWFVKDKSDPLSGINPIVDLVAHSGRVFRTEIGPPNFFRITDALPSDVILQPETAQFFVGFQASSEYTSWLCPTSPHFFPAYKTRPIPSSTGVFPSSLRILPESAIAPVIAVRSALGVLRYGAIGEE